MQTTTHKAEAARLLHPEAAALRERALASFGGQVWLRPLDGGLWGVRVLPPHQQDARQAVWLAKA